MCLAYFLWDPDQGTLIIANNRDEFYDRKTYDMHWWTDNNILAPQDAISGGTWFAIGANAKVAFITNTRQENIDQLYSAHTDKKDTTSKNTLTAPPQYSRGILPVDFVNSNKDAQSYAAELHRLLHENPQRYEGFNLLLFDSITAHNPQAWWVNNILDTIEKIDSGYHGISNAALDTPWPKVSTGLPIFIDNVSHNSSLTQYLPLLTDPTPAQYDPDKDFSERTKALSAKYVQLDNYGTRSSIIFSAQRHRSLSKKSFTNNSTTYPAEISVLHYTHMPLEQKKHQEFTFSLPYEKS